MFRDDIMFKGCVHVMLSHVCKLSRMSKWDMMSFAGLWV